MTETHANRRWSALATHFGITTRSIRSANTGYRIKLKICRSLSNKDGSLVVESSISDSGSVEKPHTSSTEVNETSEWYELSPLIVESGMRTIYPRGLNKVFGLMFQEGYLYKDTWWRPGARKPKRCESKNQDEYAGLKKTNDIAWGQQVNNMIVCFLSKEQEIRELNILLQI